nr:MAG TPA: hypothetical protein [Caudoviricetes sp.]
MKYSTNQIFQYITCYGLSAPQKYNSTVGLWSQQEHVGGKCHERDILQ